MEKRYEDRCDEECSGKQKTPLWTTFWVLFLAIIAIGLIFTIFQRIFKPDLPDWLARIDYWDMCWILVALLVVTFVLYALTTSQLHKK
jgi:multisubunit Na+/H+ antiporter MnhF subunit